MAIKKFWWLLLLPFIPVVLNYLLPLGNYSNIGGEESLVIWLEFWGTFVNTLIFCATTIFVLLKQIDNNKEENNLNRTMINRQIELSKYMCFLEVSEIYVNCFDKTELFNLYNLWRTDREFHRDLQKKVSDLISKLDLAWYKLSQLIPTEEKAFKIQQEFNMKTLRKLLNFFWDLFHIRGTGIYNKGKLTPTEYQHDLEWMQILFPKIDDLIEVPEYLSDRLEEFKEIQYKKIVNQFCDYLSYRKEKLDNLTHNG